LQDKSTILMLLNTLPETYSKQILNTLVGNKLKHYYLSCNDIYDCTQEDHVSYAQRDRSVVAQPKADNMHLVVNEHEFSFYYNENVLNRIRGQEFPVACDTTGKYAAIALRGRGDAPGTLIIVVALSPETATARVIYNVYVSNYNAEEIAWSNDNQCLILACEGEGSTLFKVDVPSLAAQFITETDSLDTLVNVINAIDTNAPDFIGTVAKKVIERDYTII
jgi:hypothetical protein